MAHTLAEVGPRFLANLIDTMLFTVPTIGVFFIGVVLTAATARGDSPPSDGLVIFSFCGAALMFLISFAVQLFFQVRHGRSVGKWLLELRVVRSDGSPCELWRIVLLRNIVMQMISQICSIVGIIDALMIFGDQRKCLHDHLADTIVISDPRQ